MKSLIRSFNLLLGVINPLMFFQQRREIHIRDQWGKRGYADKTEISKNVDKLIKELFDKIIDVEMRMSYSMVNNQKMMIELWDYNAMNTIKGYTTIPLIDIANGRIDLPVDILRREKKRKNPSKLY